MRNRLKAAFAVAAAMLTVITARGAGSDGDTLRCHPVTSVYSVEIGRQSSLATYLSPLTYGGPVFGASGSWSKALARNPERLTMSFDTKVNVASMLNPYGNARMIGLDFQFQWGLSRRWRLDGGWQIQAGGDIGIDGGALYLIRNGNNPVAAQASVAISPRGRVSKTLKIGRLPVLLADEVRLPSLSVFFSPEFGETYYEIYLGNHKGLAHCGWWGNNFCISNLLSADLDFGRTAMRIGYRMELRSSYVCSLNTRIITHCFVLGIIPQGLGLKKRRLPARTSAIYAVY